jgi:hypothetical protein
MRIPTPDVTTGQAGNRTYLLVKQYDLLVKRYDRTDVGGRWRCLQQGVHPLTAGRFKFCGWSPAPAQRPVLAP